MLWEGLKLMGVGMTTVMLFLMAMIACIEWVKHFTRKYTILEQQALQARRKYNRNSTETETDISSTVPVEVFSAAITAFDSEKNTA